MAKALKCDRCGQFYGLLKGSRNYQIRDMNEVRFDKQVDLCPDCYGVFTKWLTGEKLQSDPISDLADSVYGIGEFQEHTCDTCFYERLEEYKDPCKDCGTLLEGHTNWRPKVKKEETK